VINPAERNALIGIKPTVGLTSRAGVVPESAHQDTVGTFAKTVKDAVYALDAIYGPDPRDNYTAAQVGKTPLGGYAQFLADKNALKGATFGLPWASFWALNNPAQNAQLTELLNLISSAGATVINGTELPDYQTIVSPTGWNWDYGSTRGYPNESEYTVVKVDVCGVMVLLLLPTNVLSSVLQQYRRLSLRADKHEYQIPPRYRRLQCR